MPHKGRLIDMKGITEYKLIGFDMMRTLLETSSGAKFPIDAADWKWRPGRLEKINALPLSLDRFVATNQGGVAYGILPKEEVDHQLRVAASQISAELYVCYHHPEAGRGRSHIPELAIECDCRKPKPGLLIQAMKFAHVDPAETLFVGDGLEDKSAAEAAGCDFCLSQVFFREGQLIEFAELENLRILANENGFGLAVVYSPVYEIQVAYVARAELAEFPVTAQGMEEAMNWMLAEIEQEKASRQDSDEFP
jgi:D-glycero-D-manno-heptose 1,7-bisphosphate phosphatase